MSLVIAEICSTDTNKRLCNDRGSRISKLTTQREYALDGQERVNRITPHYEETVSDTLQLIALCVPKLYQLDILKSFRIPTTLAFQSWYLKQFVSIGMRLGIQPAVVMRRKAAANVTF